MLKNIWPLTGWLKRVKIALALGGLALCAILMNPFAARGQQHSPAAQPAKQAPTKTTIDYSRFTHQTHQGLVKVPNTNFARDLKCDSCHEGINFTLNAYANLGVGTDKPEPDVGRFAVTKDPADWGAFKTPTLRDVAKTAPYMHDGSLANLSQVVNYYNKGGLPNKNLSEKIKPLHLTEQEKEDLVAFLNALTGDVPPVTPPAKLPD